MDAKWMCFVMFDLIILAYSSPGRFHHDFHDLHHNHGYRQWGHGDWESHGWFGGYTTQRARTTAKTTKAYGEAEIRNPIATPPQPVISDTEIRLGEITPSSTSLPFKTSVIQTQTQSPTKDETSNVFTGQEDEKNATKIEQIQTVFTNRPQDKKNNNTDNEQNMFTGSEDKNNITDLFEAIQAVFTTGPLDETNGIGVTSNGKVNLGTVTGGEGTVNLTFGSGVSSTSDGETRQWQVAIYKKTVTYDLICGGSLLKIDLVLTAGSCFSSFTFLRLDELAVVAGKRYPRWQDPRDLRAQYADVRKMAITPTPCQPDLAFLTLATPIAITEGIKPVCINFGQDLETRGLGTMASWETFEDGKCKPSRELNWLSVPYNEQVCTGSETAYVKICDEELNNNTLCETDSGHGLIIYQDQVPYLRGVASFNPEARCSKLTFIDINTAVIESNESAKEYLKDLPTTRCEELYKTESQNSNPVSAENFQPINGIGEETGNDNNNVTDIPVGVGWFTAQGTGSRPVPMLSGFSAPAFQWHVGVYSKAWTPYMQICGGSLVKRDVVISAAHCFWDDASGLQPASRFAVAAGKLYRPWNDTQDTYAQHSNVSKIFVPVRFRGSATSFQDDIAVLRLRTPFTYAPGVQSACVDFSMQFDRQQLRPGNLGTVAGWGLTQENGRPSQRLNYLELPYVNVEDCFALSAPSFQKYITSDKICAGDQFTGKALCRGDSGGGLVLFSDKTPYLRGVASTAAGNQNLCNPFAIAAITQVYAHRTFLRDNIPDIDKECAGLGNREVAGTDRNVELVAGNGDIMQSTSPFPFNHFVCNCNCKP